MAKADQDDPRYWDQLKEMVEDIRRTDPDATPEKYRTALNRWHAKITRYGMAPYNEFSDLFGVSRPLLEDSEAYRNWMKRVAVVNMAYPAPWEDGYDPTQVAPPIVESPLTPRGPATADELAEIHFRQMMADSSEAPNPFDDPEYHAAVAEERRRAKERKRERCGGPDREFPF